jgi:hypothetical protein
MDWTPQSIRYVLLELVRETPLACRALYRVEEVVFTTEVPTLSVSIAERSVLYINPEFCKEHLRSEVEVKAVLMHEFFHILLGHTEKFTFSTPLHNLALDAIINAMIHRIFGEEYSSFFQRFYQGKGWQALLQPSRENSRLDFTLLAIHRKIYEGGISSDDLHAYLSYLEDSVEAEALGGIVFIGNHKAGNGYAMSQVLQNSLEQYKEFLSEQMNSGRSSSSFAHESIQWNGDKASIAMEWRRKTRAILLSCLVPGGKISKNPKRYTAYLPILHGKDRRSLISSFATEVIPLAHHALWGPGVKELVNVYLDVSYSMKDELEALLKLLKYFSAEFRFKCWSFSTVITPATLNAQGFSGHTSGGTDLGCVLEHIANTRCAKALIVTDGYVGPIDMALLSRATKRRKIAVLVSPQGNTSDLEAAGMFWEKLSSLAV